MSIVSVFYGTANTEYRTTAQGGVYQNWAYTAPLHWHGAYAAPTPTGEAINAPTAAVAIPHNLFTGFSDGYWVHRVFLDGHLVGTYTFVDQQFAVPVLHDYIQSVAMPFSPAEAGARGDDPCVPSPAGAAALLCAALFTRFRARKA